MGAQNILQENERVVVLCELAKENLARLGIRTVDIKRYMAKLGFRCYMPMPHSFSLKEINVETEHYETNVFFMKK